MQYELFLRDWRPMSSAPRNAIWIEAILKDGTTQRIHFAQDLSGEYQPAFSGWYYEKSGASMFYEVYPDPVKWRPDADPKENAERWIHDDVHRQTDQHSGSRSQGRGHL